MSRKVILATLLLLLISASSWGYENQFALSGSLGAGTTNLHYDDTNESYWGFGPSLSTHVGYRWTNFELSAYSLINMGFMEKMRQRAQGSTIDGKVSFRGVAFGPSLKYHTYYTPIGNWRFYLFGAPLVGMFTTRPFDGRPTVTGGTYQPNNPIKYEEYGGIIAIGLGKQTIKHTEMLFYEISYKQMIARRLSVLGSNLRETQIIHKERMQYKIIEKVIAFNVGMVLF